MLDKDFTISFNGDCISKEIWNYEIGYIRNSELQYYTDSQENSYIENDELVICACKTNSDEFPYTSASLNTKGKFEILYGKLEMIAKLPYGTGIWPAFWTLGSTFSKNEHWPLCGEIDIMEMIGGRGSLHNGGGDSEYFSTVHCIEESSLLISSVSKRIESAAFCDDYHKFGMLWDEDEISFMLDDEVWKSINIKNVPAFHKPHFILINLAVGGDWPGSPDETTVFPQKYRIKSITYTPLSE